MRPDWRSQERIRRRLSRRCVCAVTKPLWDPSEYVPAAAVQANSCASGREHTHRGPPPSPLTAAETRSSHKAAKDLEKLPRCPPPALRQTVPRWRVRSECRAGERRVPGTAMPRLGCSFGERRPRGMKLPGPFGRRCFPSPNHEKFLSAL